jgi:dienelactone hydrolase
MTDRRQFLSMGALAAFSSVAPAQTAPLPAAAAVARKVWPAGVAKVEIPASDGVMQPAMWFAPTTSGPKPLLVGLHTWSSNYASAGGDAVYAEWCIAQGWAFVHPHFRGPNNTPQAMGSERAVADVVEAVAWARKQTAVDPERIYLIGVSGGGHMALQMAGQHPELWAAVSAWCGISDIAQWHTDHLKNGLPDTYGKHIEAALGGSPTSSEALKAEAWKRSPLSSLATAKGLPLDINHGIHDGRAGSVPFSHSLKAFNAVVGAGSTALAPAKIEEYYHAQKLPAGWTAPAADAVYGAWEPRFRQTAGNTRVTVFEGGHEIVHQAALNWLSAQRKGKPAVWGLKDFIKLEVGGGESGK